ncbi:MAG: PEP-CTERM sorting domain-containing protein [Planctomycetota bacterium]
MRLFFGIVAALVLAVGAPAQMLVNGDMEYQETGPYGGIFGWGPQGAWAPHSAHTPPGGGYDPVLGDNFGYYSAQGTETVGQITSYAFAPDTTYEFDAWATGGSSGFGEIVFEIGYDLGGEFQLLVTNPVAVTDAWAPYVGASYTVGSTGDEIGLPIWVRIGDGIDGAPGDSDIWFDNLTLTPEPASLLLLLGGLGLLRRR